MVSGEPGGTFLQYKVKFFNLFQYTEGQIKAAKETHNQLAQCIFKLRDFPLPMASTNLDDPE